MFAWRGSVEDLETGRPTVVRVLFSKGEYLRGPVVFQEPIDGEPGWGEAHLLRGLLLRADPGA
jgi:hypothetical protein